MHAAVTTHLRDYLVRSRTSACAVSIPLTDTGPGTEPDSVRCEVHP
jgi:hypothetical protein